MFCAQETPMRRQTHRQMVAEGLARIEACLAVGDFPAATHAWQTFEAHGWLAPLERWPPTDPARLRATAIVAELAFARGQQQEAQTVLADYLADPDAFLAPDNGLRIHGKLQLAEWYYARRESHLAIHFAEQLLAQCDATHDAPVRPSLEERGELHYYLARFYGRLHQYATVDQHSDQALAAFAQAAMADTGAEAPRRLRWRIGLVLMVAGFTHWRAGHLAKATSQLQLAKWLLHQTQDVISQANVDQYLGGI